MTYTEILSEFTAIAEDYKFPVTWHSFIQIPPSHCFGTYCVPETHFDGADMIAMYKHESAEFVLFFKDGKTETDFEIEKEFEIAVCPAGEFDKKCGFDSTNGLFYTVYTFLCTERI